jgi:hypothetical protein
MEEKLKKELVNEKDFPEMVYCRHMNEGLAKYDEDNTMLLIGTEAMKKMSPTLNAKPVYIDHQDVKLDTLKNDADGYIVDSFYNELDGWLWAKMMLITDKSKDVVRRGYSVSNAYTPTTSGISGSCHNVPFDDEVKGGNFTHMALVSNPRYENAKIYTQDQFKSYQSKLRNQLDELKNSKKEHKKMSILDFFNVKKEVVENSSDISRDTFFRPSKDAEPVKLGDMLDMVENGMEEEKKKKKEEEKENECDEKYMENTLTVGGEKMTVRELANRYGKIKATKNSILVKDESDKETARINAIKEKEAKAVENARILALNVCNEKKNAHHFDKMDLPSHADDKAPKEHQENLKNSRSTAPAYHSMFDGFKKGSEQY